MVQNKMKIILQPSGLVRSVLPALSTAIFLFSRMSCVADQGAGVAGSSESVQKPKEAAIMKIKEHKSGKWSPEFTDAEKQTLFRIALDTLEWCVNGGKGEFQFDKYQLTPKMKEKTATFVTLKLDGMLRGCIGSLMPVEQLYKSVSSNAVNAAMHDPRFRQVSTKELPQLEVHVSVLSPIKDIPSVDEFKLGEHGIIIENGFNKAVYLPEVAPEQGWTREETLSSLSEKAGMSSDAWKKGAKFKVFSSVVLELEKK
jgi:uncharacterized protein